MHVNIYSPQYKRLEDGTAVYNGRKGRGFFTSIDSFLFMQVTDDHPRTGAVIDLPDGRYRLLSQNVGINTAGSYYWMAMKDSILARLLAKWYRFLGRYGYRIVRWEHKYGGLWQLQPGDELPWWSLSGILFRSFVQPK